MNDFDIELDSQKNHSSSATQWKGAPAIHLAHQMNEQCIDLLCQLAMEQSIGVHWSFLTSNRDLWSRLDGEARRRLTTFPFVIVDIRFGDESWWNQTNKEVPVSRADRSAVGSGHGLRWEGLALEALMFAWQVAREDRRVAHMVFGMAPAVTRSIAALSMQGVRIISARCAQVMRIRWDEKPKFWRELLIASRAADADEFVALKHHAERRLLSMLRRAHQT